MYVDPFVAGIISTILAEMGAFLISAILYNLLKKKEEE